MVGMAASGAVNPGASRPEIRRPWTRPVSIPMFEIVHLAATMLLALSTAALAVGVVRQGRRTRELGAALGAEREAREELARDLAALLECSRELGGRVRDQAARQKSVAD